MITVSATLASLFTLARFIDRQTQGIGDPLDCATLALFARGISRGWITGGTPVAPTFARRAPALARMDLADAIRTANAWSADPASGGAFEIIRRGKSLELIHTSAIWAKAREAAAFDACAKWWDSAAGNGMVA